MLITKEIETLLHGRNIKHYESLGYIIPRKDDGYIPKGTKIKVKTTDLQENSNMLVEVQCDNCNKKYELKYQKYSKYVHNDGIYYCNSCASTIFNSGENHPLYGKKRPLTTRNKISEGRKGKYTKENNPNWNPNITQEERELNRKTLENLEWKKKVIARDNHTCQCCNKVGNHDIVVHHLDGWNWCIEKRYDETNGITLCENCHKNFHLEYGNGNNTKEQFEEWIGHTIKVLKYNGKLQTTRKVYCIEEEKIYDGAKNVAECFNLSSNSIVYDICNHKTKHCQKKCKRKDGTIYIQKYKTSPKTIRGKHLIWYDEFFKIKGEINNETSN